MPGDGRSATQGYVAACSRTCEPGEGRPSRNLLRRMAETNQPQLPSQPGGPVPSPGEPGPAPSLSGADAGGALAAVRIFVAVLLGTTLLGVAAGFVWAAAAPRALLVVVGRGSADVVNPETAAFIAADGWFVLLCAIGGVISGLLGYLFAVRRHGVSAMVGVLAGAVAAALIARWIGQQSGTAEFNHLLAVSRPGVFLRAPVALGGVGALAFWPLAAGLSAGGFEAIRYYRDRRRAFGQRSAAAAAPHYGLAAAEIPPLGPRPSGGPGAVTGHPDSTASERMSWPAERYGPGRTGDPAD
jgi:hypothetical protein